MDFKTISTKINIGILTLSTVILLVSATLMYNDLQTTRKENEELYKKVILNNNDDIKSRKKITILWGLSFVEIVVNIFLCEE